MTQPSSELLLSTQKIVSGYGKMEILHGVDIDLKAGELVAIIGPNGCGKSTLLRLLAGLLRPWSGQVSFLGDDVSQSSPRDRLLKGISFVPQVRGVFRGLTVAENVLTGLHAFSHVGRRQAIDRVMELLPSLEEYWTKPAGSLSGGQQQIVALARALVSEPRVLLLDEPSAGLSPIMMSYVLEQVRNIATLRNVGVLLVEQNTDQALKVADRGYVLVNGYNRLTGAANELLNHPDLAGIFLGAA